MPINDQITSDQLWRFRLAVERGHREFLDIAQKCDDFLIGNQWDTRDTDALKAAGRPYLTINKILPTLSNIFGAQIQNRTEVVFRPTGLGADAATAEALTKVWTHIAQENDLPWVRSEVFADGCVRGRGFFDVRLDFTDNINGAVKISNVNSKNVIIDPDADQYDPSTWSEVMVSRWMTVDDISMLYGKKNANLLRDNAGGLFSLGFDQVDLFRERFAGQGPLLTNSYIGQVDFKDGGDTRRNLRIIERQYRKLARAKHFIDTTSGDMFLIPESWDDNRIAAQIASSQIPLQVFEKITKRVRWTVTAANVVLHDAWSPYNNNFTLVPYFPIFRHGRPLGLVENLLSPQELLNKTSSQSLHVVNTTANSGYVVKAGSLKNMTTAQLAQQGSQTGLVIETINGPSDIEKIKPNQTPTGLDRLAYQADENIKNISGVSDAMRGDVREDVAAKAIIAQQQTGQTNLVMANDNLARTDKILARVVLDIVQTYYTEPRLLHITHDDITNTQEQVGVNQKQPDGTVLNDLTLGRYDVSVATMPARQTMEDTAFEQVLAMRKEGVQIPDIELIRNSRLPNRAELIKQMQQPDPTAQQKSQLDMELLQAQIAELQAKAQSLGGKTMVDQARVGVEQAKAQQLSASAQATMANVGGSEAQAGMQNDMVLRQQEIEVKREIEQAKIEQKRQEAEIELEIATKRMELEASLKLQEFKQQMALEQVRNATAVQEKAKESAEQGADEVAQADAEFVKRLQAAFAGAKPPVSAEPEQDDNFY